jgi:hypothetical protein
MDILALILMVAAVALFLTRNLHWGLACVAAALICQFVSLTGHMITAR